MTPKKYLSNKKITTQNISISPALKDWIHRYVSKMNKKNPEDDRFKSISAFFCNVMEKVLMLFEKGKTLDDFNELEDKEIRNFYDKFSAPFLIPLIEPELNPGRYLKIDFKSVIRYFMMFRNFFMKNIDPFDYKSVLLMFNRIKGRYRYSNLTKDLRLDIFTNKLKPPHYNGVIEHSGFYKNIHMLNCKLMAEITGYLGLKITDFTYSDEDLYYRLDLETTDLFFKKELVKRERIKLLEENIKYIINYYRILKDKDYYLWLKLAENNDLFIDFKSQKVRQKWLNIIEQDLEKYGENDEFLLGMLKFFEHLHWISILNKENLSFRFELSQKKSAPEREFLVNYFSKYAKVIQENEYYFLEKKHNK
ncbi:MAG: hypothetical protein ACTSPD_12505 [Promethearchaeota archaeon]